LHTASIPGLLGTFQNEWDGLMLSNFALEQQLHTARQELSHALYQHDSACRVIARLKKERDEARQLLAEVERHIPAAPEAVTANAALSNGKRAAVDEELGPDAKKLCPGISAEIITELTDCNAALSQKRKKRQVLHIDSYLSLNMHLNVRRQDLTTCYVYVFFLVCRGM